MTPQEIIQDQIKRLEAREIHLKGIKQGIDSSLQKITDELNTLRGQKSSKPPLPTIPLGGWEEIQRRTQ